MTEAKREPVDYRYDVLVWDFVKALAQIAAYAEDKYGAATNYQQSVLSGDKSPMNHIIEHYREYMAGTPHDKFGNVQMQLAAIAYNAMMEWFYVTRGLKGEVGPPAPKYVIDYNHEAQWRQISDYEPQNEPTPNNPK